MLLDRGADVNAQGGHYGNALQAASEAGHARIVQTLPDRGARLTVESLFSISSRKLLIIIPLLLPYLAEDAVLERDVDYGKTLLHWAAELGFSSLARRCLDQFGETALHYAAENGHLDIVQTLVRVGANRTIVDSHARTALDCARGAGPGDDRRSHPDIVAYLQQ